MFRGQKYSTPQTKSIIGVLFVTCLAFFGSQVSPIAGYFLALLTLLIMITAMYMNSIWPTQARKENFLIFSLFWGLIIGTLVPFLVTTYIEGGASAVYEIFTSTL